MAKQRCVICNPEMDEDGHPIAPPSTAFHPSGCPKYCPACAGGKKKHKFPSCYGPNGVAKEHIHGNTMRHPASRSRHQPALPFVSAVASPPKKPKTAESVKIQPRHAGLAEKAPIALGPELSHKAFDSHYPMTVKGLVAAFDSTYNENVHEIIKRGFLGPRPGARRGKDMVLCVDHCKTQGDKVGEGFALNLMDCETHELLHQQFVASCALVDICSALASVCSLDYVRGNVRIIYYDKVTRNTAQKIKLATGCDHVLQDIWHVSNSINSTCNNRVRYNKTMPCL